MEKNLIIGLIEDLSVKEANQLSPLQLAYIGDAVYELFIRNYIISKRKVSVHQLHKESIKYVKAKAQKDIVFAIKDNLTEEEWNTVKRGRNAKSGTIPKNADVQDYKYATGFETLIGYLYLLKRFDRLVEVLEMIKALDEKA